LPVADWVPLTFDTGAWRQVRDNSWLDGNGDAVIVDFFGLRPDLPATLADLQGLRSSMGVQAAAQGGGLVELDVAAVDGTDAVRQIVKLSNFDQEPGVVYIGSFVVPRAECCACNASRGLPPGCGTPSSPTSGTGCRRRDPDGARHGRLGAPPVHLRRAGRSPRNQADDEAWDEHFPDHPLSRVRHSLRRTRPIDLPGPALQGHAGLLRPGRVTTSVP
jgi:hypothetical protein